jgi:hypothetical protein
MAIHFDCEIEFFGGPVDGHVDLMTLPLEPFLGVATTPKKDVQTLLDLLSRWFRSRKRGVPFAVYELDGDGEKLCYRYRGSHIVCEKRLHDESGVGPVVERFNRTIR